MFRNYYKRVMPQPPSYKTLSLYISHYDAEPFSITALARACSQERDECYLAVHYSAEEDTYKILAFNGQGTLAIHLDVYFSNEKFFSLLNNIVRNWGITQSKLCCHANLGEIHGIHLTDAVHSLVMFLRPRHIYFMTENDACEEDARRYLLNDHSALGYNLPVTYVEGDCFPEAKIHDALQNSTLFSSWMKHPTYRSNPSTQKNLLSVYVFDMDTTLPVQDMVNRISTALHEPSVIAFYNADTQEYTVTQLVTRLYEPLPLSKRTSSEEDTPPPGRNLPIYSPTEPLSLRHFSQFVRAISSHFYLSRKDGIRLCTSATLGVPTSPYITQAMNDLMLEIKPQTAHLIVDTSGCSSDVTGYLKRSITHNGYQLPASLLYANTFHASRVEHLDHQATYERLLNLFASPFCVKLPRPSEQPSCISRMFQSCGTFFGCVSRPTLSSYVTPSNRALETDKPEIIPKPPERISFAPEG